MLPVRSQGDGPSTLAGVRTALLSLDENRNLQNVGMAEAQLVQVLRARRIGAGLVGVFGIVALLLAVVGIHAVMSQVAAQRKHEIGIRMALGADPMGVLRMVVGQGMALVGLGVATGLVAALVGGRLIADLLYGVRPSDPITLAAVPILLASVAFFACFIPALRSTRTNPADALSPE